MADKVEKRILTLYSDVQATSVHWLWYPFIAVGKITLLQGDPGDGKSTMMMNLIAELSTGGKTPDGCKIGVPQKVIYQCSEDGVSDTIKPRLERCGADCRKIAFINEEVYNGLTLDDERIRQAIIEFRPRLVVIDPIQAYLGSDSDLQIAGRARKLMRRLGMWAAQMSSAALLAPSEMLSFIDSMTAPMSLINALLVGIATKMGTDVTKTFTTLERLWDQYDVFGGADDE